MIITKQPTPIVLKRKNVLPNILIWRHLKKNEDMFDIINKLFFLSKLSNKLKKKELHQDTKKIRKSKEIFLKTDNDFHEMDEKKYEKL